MDGRKTIYKSRVASSHYARSRIGFFLLLNPKRALFEAKISDLVTDVIHEEERKKRFQPKCVTALSMPRALFVRNASSGSETAT